MRPRVFVIGAYLPNGGTLMAWHLGRLIAEEFGYEPVVVQVQQETPGHGIFDYDPVYPQITVAQMEAAIGPDDLMVVNPSFSPRMFGLRLPGRKICHVLGFSTFSLLDRFDLHVAGSDFVRDFLKTTYGLSTSVITPFIDLEAIDAAPPPSPWRERPTGPIPVLHKGGPMAQPFRDRLGAILKARAPEIVIEDLALREREPHARFVERLGRYRHVVTLSLAEGFGLVPVEAMAMGTAVVGFDGFGGRHYMRDGVNCAVARYPDIEGVAERLIDLVRDPGKAGRIAAAGKATARNHGYTPYRTGWIAELSKFLGVEPRRS